MLFYEEVTDSLYWIFGYQQDQPQLNSDNIIRLPYNIGLTGIAIEKKTCVVFKKGERTPGFVSEIDNFNNIQGVRNILICPFFDENNKIRGVIQLMNKIGGDRIPDQDILEISSICPSLSQVLKLVDIARDV